MKKLFILAAASVASLSAMTSCGQGSAKLTTYEDTLSYAVGTDIGYMAFQLDSTMNPDILAAAIKDAFAKKSTMTREEAGAFIQEYMTVGMARRNAAAGKKFIEEAVKDGAQTLPSGLAYKIDKQGGDRKVALGDSIYVNYTLSLPNGQELQKSSDAMLLDAQHLIPAWLEGVPLIGEGGKITLFTPASLAYGEQGRPGIAPNQALKFDIEVVKVVPGTPDTMPADK
ncbi:MAG: FKBP-type peptidyl-prolyl cis-trans isomerase [Rikenellaceae bacterium]|nr:FKBP-type peptidyl-prolyl cis-trans isomerase [Rikenellaceae bacterium]